MNSWFAVYTQAGKEGLAKQHLENQGFSVLLPLYEKTRRHARRVEQVQRPLFPRYLFINPSAESAGWRSVNGTVGVQYVLADGGQPIVVPDHIIAGITTRMDDRGLVVLEDQGLTVGQRIRVTDGPFAEAEGLFRAKSSKERVIVLLSVLGSSVPASIPETYVQAAS